MRELKFNLERLGDIVSLFLEGKGTEYTLEEIKEGVYEGLPNFQERYGQTSSPDDQKKNTAYRKLYSKDFSVLTDEYKILVLKRKSKSVRLSDSEKIYRLNPNLNFLVELIADSKEDSEFDKYFVSRVIVLSHYAVKNLGFMKETVNGIFVTNPNIGRKIVNSFAKQECINDLDAINFLKTLIGFDDTFNVWKISCEKGNKDISECFERGIAKIPNDVDQKTYVDFAEYVKNRDFVVAAHNNNKENVVYGVGFFVSEGIISSDGDCIRDVLWIQKFDTPVILKKSKKLKFGLFYKMEDADQINDIFEEIDFNPAGITSSYDDPSQEHNDENKN